MVTGDTMFLSSFLLIFLAEIADKTQLLVLTLSRRYSLPTLLIGMSVAALVLNGSEPSSFCSLAFIRFGPLIPP